VIEIAKLHNVDAWDVVLSIALSSDNRRNRGCIQTSWHDVSGSQVNAVGPALPVVDIAIPMWADGDRGWRVGRNRHRDHHSE
jgi:hypothetical protein